MQVRTWPRWRPSLRGNAKKFSVDRYKRKLPDTVSLSVCHTEESSVPLMNGRQWTAEMPSSLFSIGINSNDCI